MDYTVHSCFCSGFRTVHLQGQEITGVCDRLERRRDPDRPAEGEQVHRDQLDPQSLYFISFMNILSKKLDRFEVA